jgi:hypothetical protein
MKRLVCDMTNNGVWYDGIGVWYDECIGVWYDELLVCDMTNIRIHIGVWYDETTTK